MPTPTGHEVSFDVDQIIVSKTDLRGIITYANSVFCRVAGYTESELLGVNHNIIRHPAMPRVVFQLLWQTIQAGEEIFAYVINMARNGDHYWVYAHVTPTFDDSGAIIGYHSNRRVPDRSAVSKVEKLYADLLAIEQRAKSPRAGMQAAGKTMQGLLQEQGCTYSEFVWSL